MDRETIAVGMADERAESNVEIVEKMIANGLIGRYEVIQQHIAGDYVCLMPDGLPYGGVHHGWDGYTQIFAKMLEFFSEVAFGPNEYVGHEDRVIVLSHLKGTLRASGRTIDMPIIEVWQLAEGMVKAITPFYFDTKVICDLNEA